MVEQVEGIGGEFQLKPFADWELLGEAQIDYVSSRLAVSVTFRPRYLEGTARTEHTTGDAGIRLGAHVFGGIG